MSTVTLKSAAVTAVVLVLAVAAPAAVITVPLTSLSGGDSGWDVTYDDTYVDVVVDQVNHDKDFVLIEASKDFDKGPDPVTGQFPPLTMDFTQRLDDGATVSTIIVGDESLTNLTGCAWTDFHWHVEVLDPADAWFDVAASGAFGIQPSPHFQQQQWTTWAADPTRADALDVFDGTVVSGSSYFPGVDDSDLVIRTNLAGADPVSFTLEQYPTPEPATLAFLAAGGGVLALLRKRRVRTQGKEVSGNQEG